MEGHRLLIGHTITMDEERPVAYGVVYCGSKIVDVCESEASVLFWRERLHPSMITNARATVMPGFVDPHSHFLGTGRHLQNVILSPERVTRVDDILKLLRQTAANTPKGVWIRGNGYDDTLLVEKRHPTRLELDSVSLDHPILISHISGHVGVASSVALKERGLPVEGSGLLEEGTLFKATRGLSRNTTASIEAARKLYLSHGITTACEAWFLRDDWETVCSNEFPLLGCDLVVYPICLGNDVTKCLDIVDALLASPVKGVRLGGVKLVFDGSIQAWTAALTRPYYKTRDATMSPFHKGHPTYSQTDANLLVRTFLARGLDLQVHCNGDAAIDMLLEAVESASENTNGRMVTVIHCQTVRPDQLERMQRLSCVHPSFFVGHTWYWGQRHADIFLGPERASKIDPCADAMRHPNLIVSCHHDSPVVSASMVDILFSAVNRITREGSTLGADERISIEDALKTVTVNAARQLGCLGAKGILAEREGCRFCFAQQEPYHNISKVNPLHSRPLHNYQGHRGF